METEGFKIRTASAMINAIALLPSGMLYMISDIASFILYRIVRYRRNIVRENLKNVFRDKEEKELSTIEHQFYRHFCDVIVETIRLARISSLEITRRVEINGAESVNESLSQGKPVILLLGHCGNWEWVTCAALKFLPTAVSCEIYHPLRDKTIDKLMLRLRSRFGTENIPMSRAVRRLLHLADEQKVFVCGFISDQRPFDAHLRHWTEFLGIKTAYVNGGEIIGTKIGAHFFYVDMEPQKRGHYKMTFKRLEPLADGDENPYTRAFLRELEASIRRNPPYWLWSHNRWKRKRQPGE